jgi:hypothetical protein
MPKNFGYKINLERGDLRLRWKVMTAIVWKGKWNVNILTNMYSPSL